MYDELRQCNAMTMQKMWDSSEIEGKGRECVCVLFSGVERNQRAMNRPNAPENISNFNNL